MGKENCLKVQMLGEFSMTYQGKKIQIGRNQTTKGLRLLQLLLHAYPGGLSKREVLENLFERDAEGDIANNLRVVVHNLRKMLQESELPKENYINIDDGRYYFDCSYPLEIDVLLFEEFIEKAGKTEGEERLEYLKKACDLYKGLFLPALAGEEWVIVADAHYQHLYFRCMEDLCMLMKEQGRYEEMLTYCNQAAALYPFDEWQVWQMECLMRLNRSKEAMDLYEATTSMYFDELGLPPSDRMLELFRQMRSQIQLSVSDFNVIQGSLKEKEEDTGAYYCSYPCFMNLYRMIARMMERSGQSNYLLLCTISDERYKPLEKTERLKNVSDKLQEAIHEALRRGDVFTRYNMSQFLVVLIGIRKEECPITTSRIDACFRKRESSRKIKISYRMASIANVRDKDDVDKVFS